MLWIGAAFGARWVLLGGGLRAVAPPLLEGSWNTERTKGVCTVK